MSVCSFLPKITLRLSPITKACRAASHVRGRSTLTEPGKEEAIVLTNDKEVLVCWHPEPVIPYSCTQPLPVAAETDTVLKTQYDENVKQLYKRQHPYYVSKKLQEITFTTKHRWFPNNRWKFDSKITPREREYL